MSTAEVPRNGTVKTTPAARRETPDPATAATSRLLVGDDLVEVEPVPSRDPADRVSQPAAGNEHGPTPGVLLDDKFEVVGWLSSGGMGRVYLARDLSIDGTYRVLKGLLDATDPDATRMAIAERQFLSRMDHHNIVKIITFVTYEGDGYIVMPYLDGVSLRDVLDEPRAVNGGRRGPLPAEEAVGYVVDVLPALGYLHEKRLLHCDVKPDNVMKTKDGPVLIDLGAVQRIDEEHPGEHGGYGTVGYLAPEVAAGKHPSVTSDLYSVGRTLAVLCTGFDPGAPATRYAIPDPTEVDAFRDCDSLYRLLVKATGEDPTDRFQSAEEMRDQLRRVLYELVAARGGTPPARASTFFTGDRQADPDRADWHRLPQLLVDGDDPAAGYLATLTITEPDELIRTLLEAHQTPAVQLRTAYLLIEHGRADEGVAVLDRVEANDPRQWRVAWYRGLVALAAGDGRGAERHFDSVYRAVPGELAPKLALGVAAEAAGAEDDARHWYEIVSRTDPAFTSATFGLARCLRALHDHQGALEAYERVPASPFTTAARLATVRLHLEGADGSSTPDRTELSAAAKTVDALTLDGETRARLTGEVLEAALRSMDAGVVPAEPDGELLGWPITDTGVRLGLEQSYRRQARYAATRAERIGLVDRANRVRPRTWT